MEPVTVTLLSAFAAGAASAAKTLGDEVVKDAYKSLKAIITDAYAKAGDLLASLTMFENSPESKPRRELLAEELKAAGALDDPKLLAAAEAVLAAAEKLPQATAIGVDWSDVKVARLKLGNIKARAGAIGFRAARMEVTGELQLGDIEVDGSRGK